MAAKSLVEAIAIGAGQHGPYPTVLENMKNEITDYLAHEVERFTVHGMNGTVTEEQRELLIEFFKKAVGK